MKLLLIGLSSFATRRLFPAIAVSPEVEEISIASRRCVDPPDIGEKLGQVVQGYDRALEQVECDVVYVSMPNSLHFSWVKRALQSGKHVIVDKPAFVSLAETEEALSIASSRKLCLAEANVWTYHPQAAAARTAFASNEDEISYVHAVFTSPPLPIESFQYQPELGGGALLDRGPYAVSTARWAFGESPVEVICRAQRFSTTGVELSFSLFLRFDSGRTMTGYFALDCEYTNHLSLLGNHVRVDVDRVFTPPPDWECPVRCQTNNRGLTLAYKSTDAIGEFLRAVAGALKSGDYRSLANDMHADAVLLSRMRESAMCVNQYV